MPYSALFQGRLQEVDGSARCVPQSSANEALLRASLYAVTHRGNAPVAAWFVALTPTSTLSLVANGPVGMDGRQSFELWSYGADGYRPFLASGAPVTALLQTEAVSSRALGEAAWYPFAFSGDVPAFLRGFTATPHLAGALVTTPAAWRELRSLAGALQLAAPIATTRRASSFPVAQLPAFAVALDGASYVVTLDGYEVDGRPRFAVGGSTFIGSAFVSLSDVPYPSVHNVAAPLVIETSDPAPAPPAPAPGATFRVLLG